jgi:hypothetical protein
MTKAILVRKRDNTPVGGILDTSRRQWIVDPATGKRLASPARVGWENDDYALREIAAFGVPDGKRIVGERTRTYDDKTGNVIESAAVEDKPAEPVLTDAQRLERATGLTIAQIKEALG